MVDTHIRNCTALCRSVPDPDMLPTFRIRPSRGCKSKNVRRNRYSGSRVIVRQTPGPVWVVKERSGQSPVSPSESFVLSSSSSLLRTSGMALTTPGGSPLQPYVLQAEISYLQLTFHRKDTLAPWLTPAIQTGHLTGL